MEKKGKVNENEERKEREDKIQSIIEETENLEKEYEYQLKQEIETIKREEREIKLTRERKEKELEEWKKTFIKIKREVELKWKEWQVKKDAREKEEREKEKERLEFKLKENQKKRVIVRVMEDQEIDIKKWIKRQGISEKVKIRQVGREVDIYELRFDEEQEAENLWTKEWMIEREGKVKILKWLPFEERRKNFLINRMIRKIRKEMDDLEKRDIEKPRAVAFEVEGGLYVIEEENKKMEEKKKKKE